MEPPEVGVCRIQFAAGPSWASGHQFGPNSVALTGCGYLWTGRAMCGTRMCVIANTSPSSSFSEQPMQQVMKLCDDKSYITDYIWQVHDAHTALLTVCVWCEGNTHVPHFISSISIH